MTAFDDKIKETICRTKVEKSDLNRIFVFFFWWRLIAKFTEKNVQYRLC